MKKLGSNKYDLYAASTRNIQVREDRISHRPLKAEKKRKITLCGGGCVCATSGPLLPFICVGVEVARAYFARTKMPSWNASEPQINAIQSRSAGPPNIPWQMRTPVVGCTGALRGKDGAACAKKTPA